MLNIAICDDEQNICNEIERYAEILLGEKNIGYEIDIYNDSESLCAEICRTEYDIIFLDIELPGMNGVQTGTYIRAELKNYKVQIAYVSAKQGYAMELFQNQPIDFLVKPLNKQQIQKVIERYLKMFGKEPVWFEYRKNRENLRVSPEDILYFTSEGRKVTITMYKKGNSGEKSTTIETDTFYDTLDHVQELVKEKKLLHIHKSVLVNYQYIEKFGYEEVTMMDGTVFGISQSRRKEMRQQFMKIRKEGKE